jgi:hypothetical protein
MCGLAAFAVLFNYALAPSAGFAMVAPKESADVTAVPHDMTANGGGEAVPCCDEDPGSIGCSDAAVCAAACGNSPLQLDAATVTLPPDKSVSPVGADEEGARDRPHPPPKRPPKLA